LIKTKSACASSRPGLQSCAILAEFFLSAKILQSALPVAPISTLRRAKHKSSDTASGDILGSALKHASNDFCGGLAIG
jgi:hypothetical protein